MLPAFPCPSRCFSPQFMASPTTISMLTAAFWKTMPSKSLTARTLFPKAASEEPTITRKSTPHRERRKAALSSNMCTTRKLWASVWMPRKISPCISNMPTLRSRKSTTCILTQKPWSPRSSTSKTTCTCTATHDLHRHARHQFHRFRPIGHEKTETRRFRKGTHRGLFQVVQQRRGESEQITKLHF